jgi:predicted dehydrogenase
VNEVLRYGIVGTGMMGLEHLRNLQAISKVEVTAVADPHGDSLEWTRLAIAEGRQPTYFQNHRELMDSGLCDVVVIASPNDTHAAICRELLASDLHLLIEKPMATTVEDCEMILKLAEKRDAVTWVGLEYRYMPPVAKLIEVSRSGDLGEIAMLAIREHRFPFLQKVDNWNRFNKRSGGTLVEKCCHFFDLMFQITGSEPTRVMASGAQTVNHLDEHYEGQQSDIMDNAMVIVEHANGIRSSLDLCMFAEGSMNQEEISVVGSIGKAEAFLPSQEFRFGLREHWAPGVSSEIIRNEEIAHEGYHHGASYLEHLDLIKAIREGKPAAVSCRDGLRATAIGVAAQQSIAEGRVVNMSEII